MRGQQRVIRNETHAQKMERKKEKRATRETWATKNPDRVAKFAAFWQAVRRKNGVGSRARRQAYREGLAVMKALVAP